MSMLQTSNPSNSSFTPIRTPVKHHGEQMSFSTAPNMSFNAPQLSSQPGPAQMSPPAGHATTTQFRSFNPTNSLPGPPHFLSDQPQIYTAMYSGVKVYEMEVKGVACMRRRADGCLNATQILKVAGVDKGKRTKVLEKEILTGDHEKVQGGYGKYQGTWISFERGLQFCRQYGVEELLRPLLEYDREGDGATEEAHSQETPTKEQAMAANRKRMYNSSFDSRNQSGAQNGTFFSNISPMTSVALTAMERAAQLNASGPKNGGQMNGGMRQTPQLTTNQPSMTSEGSFNGEMSLDSAYGGGSQGDERPRKRMRADPDTSMAMDVSMHAPTEADASSAYPQAPSQRPEQGPDGAPLTLPPLPAPDTQDGEDRRQALMNLFHDRSRTDYSDHPAFTQLSAKDYDLPLDASANTALHWAATLGRISIVRLLLQKGANMWRGNAAGQSALISAVTVNNCSDHSCFPQLLEMLGPLIEARDAVGKTVLHHIAVSCGIKGRAPSSKYYLEALLEFLVRSASNGSSVVGNISSALHSSQPPLNLMKFLSTVVNAQDKGGNTALNLVARIGNRSIIQQLLEIRADPNIANHKGVAAKDFGVGVGDVQASDMMSFSQSTSKMGNGDLPNHELNATGMSKSSVDVLEEQNQEVISSITSMLQTNLQNHKTLLSQKAAQIDALTSQIQDLSSQQTLEQQRYDDLSNRVKLREDRERKVDNLSRLTQTPSSNPQAPNIGSADGQLSTHLNLPALDPSSLTSLSTTQLHALLRAYTRNNAALESESSSLRSQSLDLEHKYRRVISLCTNVADEKIDAMLPGLVAAVESENSAAAAAAGGLNSFLSGQKSQGAALQDATHASANGHSARSRPTSQGRARQAGQHLNSSQPQQQQQQQQHQRPGDSHHGMPGLGVGRVREFLALVEGAVGTDRPGEMTLHGAAGLSGNMSAPARPRPSAGINGPPPAGGQHVRGPGPGMMVEAS